MTRSSSARKKPNPIPRKAVPARKAPVKPAGKLGAIPQWNLADLYPGRDCPELKRDIEKVEADASGFRERYFDKVASLTGDSLGQAVAEYEAIDETLSRILSYAYLEYAGCVTDPATGKFFQTIRERATDISSKLIFFTLEINRLDDAALAEKTKAPRLAHYATWLRDVRLYRPHQLSDEMERLLHDKSVAGRGGWNRLFDETIAQLRFKVGGKMLTEPETLHLLSHPVRAKRKEAGKAVGQVFGANIKLFAHITNTLAKDKDIEDKWRNYAKPVSARNLSNQVEDEVVEALVGAVKAAFPRTAHRYYAMKAKWLGLKQLAYWDRNAPLSAKDDRTITWPEARQTVLSSYRAFSPTMADIGQQFFDRNWIDAQVRPGKESGAFSHPTVPSAHPYILMNFQGKTRDVMTLAHELGHGVHQMLARDQGHLMAETPLTLAETASVFGEMLTFQALLRDTKDAKRRKAMLAGKVEDMLNTVVRQIAFFEFERLLHDERKQGEVLPERIGEIWLQISRESLGPALQFDPEYRHFWAYIPHFVHSPFYVYAYAFGDCLVNSLYAV
ncbi:MAG: M3 family oligoendopeptidase, partial [Alphaproteobacteria bacterium]